MTASTGPSGPTPENTASVQFLPGDAHPCLPQLPSKYLCFSFKLQLRSHLLQASPSFPDGVTVDFQSYTHVSPHHSPQNCTDPSAGLSPWRL